MPALSTSCLFSLLASSSAEPSRADWFIEAQPGHPKAPSRIGAAVEARWAGLRRPGVQCDNEAKVCFDGMLEARGTARPC